MNIQQPKISIIIPIYNTEKYLSACLDSILSQSFTDYELLLINDGSKDNSGVICDNYAKNEPRIKVIHKKNEGVSSARNIGLENAIGNYICFVDSDDILAENGLVEVLPFLEENVEIFILKIKRRGLYEKELKENSCFKSEMVNQIMSGNHASTYYHYSRGSVVGVLFNNNFISKYNLRFSNGLTHAEDTLFMSLSYHLAKKVMFLDVVFYYILRREGSATYIYNYINVLSQIKALKTIEDYIVTYKINKNNAPLINSLTYTIISSVIYKFILLPNKNLEKFKEIKNTIKKSNLYPITSNDKNRNSNKIKLLNFSIELFTLSIILKNVMLKENK